MEFRNEKSAFAAGKLFNNAYAVFVVAALGFIAMLGYIPEFAVYFDIKSPDLTTYAVCLISPVLMLIIYEIYKLSSKTTKNKNKTQKNIFLDKTEEYIIESFKEKGDIETSDIEYDDEGFEVDKRYEDLDVKTLKDLIYLAVKCGITREDIARYGENSDKYEEMSQELSQSITPDSSVEIIATILITTLGTAKIKNPSFDKCIKCAQKIKEYMEIN